MADSAAEPAGLARPGWPRRTRRAAGFALSSWHASAVALLGFLVRGGLVVILLPSAVLPSVIDVAGITGVRAISIAGDPTPWLFRVLLVAVVIAATWLVLAGLLGSLTDVWLVEMARRDGRDQPRGRGRAQGQLRLPVPGLLALLELLTIRVLCLIPVGIALAWAVGRLYDVTYAELTAPSSLATPLVLRVVTGAADAVAVVVAVWLASETVAAVAIRRQVLLQGGILRSLGGAAAEIVRRPLSTLATVAVSYATSAVVTALAMAATSVAFDWCRVAARNPAPLAVTMGIGSFATTRDFRPVVFALAVVALALAWAVALVASGAASAWRSAAMTHEVAAAIGQRDPAAGGQAASSMLALSGRAAERSGD